MPISQETILAIYGDLCDLVEKIETLHDQAFEPDLFTTHTGRWAVVLDEIKALRASSHDAQQQAIAHMMHDDREIRPNPITGRLDE